MNTSRYFFSMALLGLLAFGAAASAASAQDSPFVNVKTARSLRDEVSGDRAFDVVRKLTPYHRIMGSQAYVEAAEMLAGLARQSGLENVRVVRQKFEGGLSWDARTAKLWLLGPEPMKLCDFEELPVSLAVFSRSAHLSAELVDIGRGTTAEDFAYYQRKIPGVYFFLGVAPKGSDPKKLEMNHSPRFNPDEGPMVLGVRALASLAVDYLHGAGK